MFLSTHTARWWIKKIRPHSQALAHNIREHHVMKFNAVADQQRIYRRVYMRRRILPRCFDPHWDSSVCIVHVRERANICLDGRYIWVNIIDQKGFTRTAPASDRNINVKDDDAWNYINNKKKKDSLKHYYLFIYTYRVSRVFVAAAMQNNKSERNFTKTRWQHTRISPHSYMRKLLLQPYNHKHF